MAQDVLSLTILEPILHMLQNLPKTLNISICFCISVTVKSRDKIGNLLNLCTCRLTWNRRKIKNITIQYTSQYKWSTLIWLLVLEQSLGWILLQKVIRIQSLFNLNFWFSKGSNFPLLRRFLFVIFNPLLSYSKIMWQNWKFA